MLTRFVPLFIDNCCDSNINCEVICAKKNTNHATQESGMRAETKQQRDKDNHHTNHSLLFFFPSSSCGFDSHSIKFTMLTRAVPSFHQLSSCASDLSSAATAKERVTSDGAVAAAELVFHFCSCLNRLSAGRPTSHGHGVD